MACGRGSGIGYPLLPPRSPSSPLTPRSPSSLPLLTPPHPSSCVIASALPDLLESACVYYAPKSNHVIEFQNLICDLWRREVTNKKGTSSLSHLKLKGYCPPVLIHAMYFELEYNGNLQFIYEWTPKALEAAMQEEDAKGKHISTLQIEQITALIGKRVLSVEMEDDTFYFVQMGSAKAAFLSWEPLTNMIEFHCANRKVG